MTEPGRQLREEIERLGKTAEIDLDALRRDFEAEVRALISRIGGRPEEMERKIGEAFRRFEKNLQAELREIEARLSIRFGSAAKPPQRRPYVEKFPPRTPRPRGRKRPNAGGVLVEPDKPNNLSGGAAAPLEFD